MSGISACSSPVQCRSNLPLVDYWTFWGSVLPSVKREWVVHTSQDWVNWQVLSKHSSLCCLLLFLLPHFRSDDTSVLYFSHQLSQRLGICLWSLPCMLRVGFPRRFWSGDTLYQLQSQTSQFMSWSTMYWLWELWADSVSCCWLSFLIYNLRIIFISTL